MPITIVAIIGMIPEKIMKSHADEKKTNAHAAATGGNNKIEEYSKLPIDNFIRLKEVLAILGLKKTTFQKGVREGILPKPYKFGPRISLWSIEEIRSVVDSIKRKPQDDQSID